MSGPDDLTREMTREEKLERMIERLGSATHAYLSSLTNGEQPSGEEHEYLAHIAYEYAFHLDAAIKAEPMQFSTEF